MNLPEHSIHPSVSEMKRLFEDKTVRPQLLADAQAFLYEWYSVNKQNEELPGRLSNNFDGISIDIISLPESMAVPLKEKSVSILVNHCLVAPLHGSPSITLDSGIETEEEYRLINELCEGLQLPDISAISPAHRKSHRNLGTGYLLPRSPLNAGLDIYCIRQMYSALGIDMYSGDYLNIPEFIKANILHDYCNPKRLDMIYAALHLEGAKKNHKDLNALVENIKQMNHEEIQQRSREYIHSQGITPVSATINAIVGTVCEYKYPFTVSYSEFIAKIRNIFPTMEMPIEVENMKIAQFRKTNNVGFVSFNNPPVALEIGFATSSGYCVDHVPKKQA